MHGLNSALWQAAALISLLAFLAALLLIRWAHAPPKPRLTSHYLSRWEGLILALAVILILSSLLALSGCGTPPSPAAPITPLVPAELMRPPGKPLLLAPSLPASTLTQPLPTTPPTPRPAETTAPGISA